MASKRFSLTFDVNANIGPVKNAIQQFQNLLKNTTLNIPIHIKSDIESTITKLNKEIEKFESKAGGGFSTLAEVREMERSFGRISTLMQRLKTQSSQISGLKPESFLTEKDLANIKTYQESLKTLRELKEQQNQEDRKSQKEEEKLLKRKEKISEKLNDLQKEDPNDPKKGSAKRAKEELEKEGKTLEQKRKEFEEARQKVEEGKKTRTKSGRVTDTELKEWLKGTRYEGNIAQYRKERDAFKEIDKEASALKELSQVEEDLQTLRSTREASSVNYQTNLEKLRKSLAQIKGVDIGQIPTDLKALETVIKDLNEEQLTKFSTALKQFGVEALNIDKPMADAAQEIEKFSKQAEQSSRAAEDMSRLKNQLYDFFSISNTIQIFKNTIRESFNTIKELDAVMTETAVVTDFTVGDMWEKLPEYAEQATKLGSSIKSLYEATTLYYQQGLNSEQAMSVGSETMKMARIANMDAADATEAMTAALRGFNMEIDQTSATRVNDVYSELAAITAADTSQIATAMTKTASIAASANMEFETTAAFLAQIIETTQEAPETAGTAMKTIIARFTEVKELFDEGMLTGEDEEGEAIEINKIDTALKSVGISLRDFLLGSKGIDDIFLELASKWDSLDLATQRYIATTAAGSRQQSRFIAMMSDYERTMELVTAANNSAGAGQKQFDKTLESLDAKLQRLSNAWDQFTMNLANNTLIKAGVDFLSGLLETVNKVVDAMSGGNGLIASFVTLGSVIAGLKGADSLLTRGLGGFLGRAGVKVENQEISPIRMPFTFQKISEKSLGYGPLSWFGSGVKKLVDFTPNYFAEGQLKKKEQEKVLREKELAEASEDLLFAEIERDFKKAEEVQGSQRDETYQTRYLDQKERTERARGDLQQTEEEYNAIRAKAEKKLTEEQKQASYRATQVTADALTAIGLVTTGLSTMAQEAGFEELGEGLSKFSAFAVIAGQGLGVLNQVAAMASTTLGAMMTTLGPWIAGIAVIGGALAFIGKQIYDNSYTGRMKQAEKNTVISESAAEHAASSFEKISDSFENIFKQSDNIKNMVEGTYEWLEATSQLNSDISSLVQKNPQLIDVIEYSNGLLDLDREKAKQYLKEQELESIRAKNATNRIAQQEREIRNRQKYLETGLTESQQNYSLDPTKWNKNYGVIVSGKFDEEATKSLAKQLAGVNDEQLIDYASGIMAFNAGQMHFGGYSDDQTAQLAFLKELREVGKTLTSVENEQTPEDRQYERQISDNIKQQARVQGTLDDFSQNLDSTLVKNMSDSFYKKFLADFGEVTETNKEQYAKLMDYTYDYFSGKFFDSENKEVTGITDEVIKFTLASDQADKEASSRLSEIDESFSTQEQRDKAQELLSEEGQDLSWKTINELQKQLEEQGGNFADAFKTIFGVTTEALADIMQVNPADLEEELQGNLEKGTERINKQREELVANMSKYSQYEGNVKDNAVFLAYLEQQLGEGIRGTLEGVFDSVSRSGDDNLISEVYDRFSTVALNDATMGTENYKNLSNLITDIDWSNPISAAGVLNDKLQTGDAISKDFAKNVLQMGHSFLGAGSQMRYLAQSSEFGDIKEDLNEILETSSEISASDVYDLAESYDSLDEILENTEVSAAAVGKVLEDIASGKMGIHQLTDSVLAALSGFGDLDSMIAGLNKRVSNFDPGISEAFAADFLGQAHESITALLEEGAYGNAQIGKYYDFIFGENWDKNVSGQEMFGKERMNAIKQYNKFLGQNSTNMKASWLELINKGQIAGNEVAAGKEGWKDALADRGMAIRSNGKEVFIDNLKGLTTSEMVNAMSEVLGISKTLAEMMLADYKEHSTDEAILKQNEIDAEAAAQNVRDLAQEKGYISSDGQGTYFLDKAEIQAMADKLGLEYQTMLEALKTTFSETALQITDFYDEWGALKPPEEAYDYWTKSESEGGLGQKDIDSYKVTRGDSGGVYTSIFDLAQMEKDIAKSNLPEAVQKQITQGATEAFIAQQNGQPYEINMKMSDGSVQTIKVQAGQSLEDAYAQAEKNNKQNLIADAIKAAFSGENAATLNVEIKANEGDIVGQIASIQGTVPVEGDVNTAGIASAISAIQGKVNVTGYVTSLIFPWHHAKGIKNSPTDHPALVGEEGPELIERNDGTAYLSGIGGPEVTAIQKGETVHTAQETKKILRGKRGKTMPRFKNGLPDTSSSYGKTVVSGGKEAGAGDSEAENPFDKLYNLVREIDEELRQRERIERRYEKLLESLNESANQLIATSRAQLKQLEYERELQERLISGRREQIDLYQKENEELLKYGKVEQNERGESVLRIDWDLIDSITDKKELEKIEKYMEQLEEWFDSLSEAEEALWDIEDAVQEIKERGSDEYRDLEKAISEALEESYQKEIDKLEEVNNSINETNSSLLDAVQKSIDKMRKDRENERTEEELGEKQRKLLYLQQDTFGANQLEILKLQEELEQGQEDYTDTLIDQKISELQEQNEEASKQREQQITLLQAQLDHYIENGEIWKEVYELMDNGLDKDSGLLRGSRLEEILQNADNFKGLSVIGQMDWWTDMNGMIAQALAYLEVGRQLEDIGVEEGKEVEFKTESGDVIQGTVDAQGNVVDVNGYIYDNVFQGADGKYYAGKNIKSQEELKPIEEIPESEIESEENKDQSGPKNSGGEYRYQDAKGKWWKTKAERDAANARYLQERHSDKIITYDEHKKQMEDDAKEEGKRQAAAAAAAEIQRQLSAIDKHDYEQSYEGQLEGKRTAIRAAEEASAASLRDFNAKAAAEAESARKAAVAAAASQAYAKTPTAQKAAAEAERARQAAAAAAAAAKLNESYKKVYGYSTGGLADFTGPAWLDGTKARPELVLNARDTQNFIQLKDILGSIMNRGSFSNTSTENNGDITYDIDINVESVDNDYDVEKIANKVKSLINDNARYRNNNAISLRR